MKQVVLINTISGGVSKCITAHYSKIGWKELMSDIIPATAILEIEMNKPKVIQIANLVLEQEGRFSNPQRGRVYSPDGLSPCIDCMGGGNLEPKVLLKYRIRKLTPTECLRLMGVDDTDIEKMKSAKLIQTLKPGKVKERPMPKTQLYKMAGNSIVVDVLYHIFHQMFIAEPPKPKVKQLSLFDL